MSKQITMTYCGMEGTGETVKLAKQDAARKLERLVEDTRFGPKLISLDGSTTVVFRHADGWGYGLVTLAGKPCKSLSYGVGWQSREEAEISAIQNLAQVAWNHDVDDAEFVRRACLLAPAGAQRSLEYELTRYFAWQRRYKAAKDAGHSDNECFQIACEHA